MIDLSANSVNKATLGSIGNASPVLTDLVVSVNSVRQAGAKCALKASLLVTASVKNAGLSSTARTNNAMNQAALSVRKVTTWTKVSAKHVQASSQAAPSANQQTSASIALVSTYMWTEAYVNAVKKAEISTQTLSQALASVQQDTT